MTVTAAELTRRRGEYGIDVCVIGPSVKNVAAIRAYKKAGFRALKEVQVPDEPDPEFLMRVTAHELDSMQR